MSTGQPALGPRAPDTGMRVETQPRGMSQCFLSEMPGLELQVISGVGGPSCMWRQEAEWAGWPGTSCHTSPALAIASLLQAEGDLSCALAGRWAARAGADPAGTGWARQPLPALTVSTVGSAPESEWRPHCVQDPRATQRTHGEWAWSEAVRSGQVGVRDCTGCGATTWVARRWQEARRPPTVTGGTLSCSIRGAPV